MLGQLNQSTIILVIITLIITLVFGIWKYRANIIDFLIYLPLGLSGSATFVLVCSVFLSEHRMENKNIFGINIINIIKDHYNNYCDYIQANINQVVQLACIFGIFAISYYLILHFKLKK